MGCTQAFIVFSLLRSAPFMSCVHLVTINHPLYFFFLTFNYIFSTSSLSHLHSDNLLMKCFNCSRDILLGDTDFSLPCSLRNPLIFHFERSSSFSALMISPCSLGSLTDSIYIVFYFHFSHPHPSFFSSCLFQEFPENPTSPGVTPNHAPR